MGLEARESHGLSFVGPQRRHAHHPTWAAPTFPNPRIRLPSCPKMCTAPGSWEWALSAVLLHRREVEAKQDFLCISSRIYRKAHSTFPESEWEGGPRGTQGVTLVKFPPLGNLLPRAGCPPGPWDPTSAQMTLHTHHIFETPINWTPDDQMGIRIPSNQ